MRPESPDPSFGFLIHDVSRLLRKNFDRRAQQVGLTRAQWWVLVHVHRHESSSQRALADILEIEPITLTRLIDRLEKSGWVERRPDASDRRIWRLYLTEKSYPILDRMYQLGAETREQALTGLPAEQRDQLVAILSKIKGNLGGKEPTAPETDDVAPLVAAGGE
ncbi:MAG TPA: MarR family transcriptional regulator [Candidatus Sulfotelmatobacter sp.]|nr:MarR family transcriptional regulator [Candidatus Sulfotelmatobacter sp.]